MCLLDVPVNKTSTAFTKPVDRVIGEAIRAWEQERPEQPVARDEKTGEQVHFLFSFRCARFSHGYLNRRVIPALCQKAGVPREDARGRITRNLPARAGYGTGRQRIAAATRDRAQ